MMSEWMVVHFTVATAKGHGGESVMKEDSIVMRKYEGESMEAFQERAEKGLREVYKDFSAILRIELFLSPQMESKMTVSGQTPTEKAMSADVSEYVASLENLLIFMCQSHEDVFHTLTRLAAEEQNKAILSVPKVQGIKNGLSISKIAKMTFTPPPMDFAKVAERMATHREEQTPPSE